MIRTTLSFLLFLSVFLYPQNLKLGIMGDFLTGNKYLDYQVGPALVLDFKLKDLPVSVQGKLRFYLSEFSDQNNFSGGYTITSYGAGLQANYFPITWAIEPYIGLGISYNINNLSLDGNLSTDLNGMTYSPSNIRNNFSSEIIGGIKFSAMTSINFIAEISQTFNKPKYKLNKVNTKSYTIMTKIENMNFNFNSLFFKLGLLFKI